MLKIYLFVGDSYIGSDQTPRKIRSASDRDTRIRNSTPPKLFPRSSVIFHSKSMTSHLLPPCLLPSRLHRPPYNLPVRDMPPRYKSWYFYLMVAQVTVRTYGLNHVFRLLKAFVYIERVVKSDFFWEKTY